MWPLSAVHVYLTASFWREHWTRYGNVMGENKVEVERETSKSSPGFGPINHLAAHRLPYRPWAFIANPNYGRLTN